MSFYVILVGIKKYETSIKYCRNYIASEQALGLKRLPTNLPSKFKRYDINLLNGTYYHLGIGLIGIYWKFFIEIIQMINVS